MAKFTGKNQTLTFGGNALTCIQSVEVSEDIDTFMVECAGATHKTTITGLRESSMTVNLLIETNDVTKLGYVDPGDSGAIVYLHNGATSGDIQLDATAAKVVSRNTSNPVNGLCVVTVEFNLDDIAYSAYTP